jgi:ketosteroid isomerase-like protein
MRRPGTRVGGHLSRTVTSAWTDSADRGADGQRRWAPRLSAAGTDDAVAAFSRMRRPAPSRSRRGARRRRRSSTASTARTTSPSARDGAHVYAVGAADDAVAVFSRNCRHGRAHVRRGQAGRRGRRRRPGRRDHTSRSARTARTCIRRAAATAPSPSSAGTPGTGGAHFRAGRAGARRCLRLLEIPQDAVVSADGANLYVPAQHAAAGGETTTWRCSAETPAPAC